jgi:C terminal of Calcineurin-like phosphoesterase/N terminal of Calcineurin-like phosphoesterase/Calcineurin-like phosphoesterase
MRKEIIASIIILVFIFNACQLPDDEYATGDFPYEILPGENEILAKGYVFDDLNMNRIRDEGESGIEGVAVSNGEDIVITNGDGYYGLPVDNDAIIFCIKPSDWMTPVNVDNIPQFFYIHKPKGSPEHFKYAGVSPTGDLPEEVNFPLYSEKGKSDFKIAIFGDPQPWRDEDIDFIAEDIVQELVDQKDLEFGVTMGDIVGNDLTLFNPVNQVISKIGIPWYNVIGNHDINRDAENDELSDETYERIYGPATYAFVYGNVHFIIVDDVIHFREEEKIRYVGGLREDQLVFVENYLKTVPKEDLIVLNMHIPLALHGDWFRNQDQKRLFDMLKDFPHTLSISAHSHVHNNNFFHQDSTDWQQSTPHHHLNVGTTCGSWWSGMRDENDIPHTMMQDGTPNGYAFISFKGSEYIIDWKAAGKPLEHKMNIYIPRGIAAGSADTVQIVVNYFMGSEQTKVEYRIKDLSDWQTMTHTLMFDPFYEKLYKRGEFFRKQELLKKWKSDPDYANEPLPGTSPPRKDRSPHIWTANLNKDLQAGEYVIEVRIKDRYNRTFQDHQLMRVAEKLSK